MRNALAITLLAGALAPACTPSVAAPKQPVAFSHKVHAGDNRMGCLGCHVYAQHSPVAGVPSLERCRGCHKFVAKDKPEVQKVLLAIEAGKPIEWVRVHRLPDHVFFTHERHVAAQVKCQECHGPVETMEAVSQVSPLTMGWCLDCHEKKQAARDCWTCHK